MEESGRYYKKLGAKEIVILGGEPTLYSNILDLIKYISKESKLTCNLTTNAFDNYELVKQLLENGLNSLGVSIDTLDLKLYQSFESKNGLQLINYLKSFDIDFKIVNYTVLNNKNVNSITNLIKYMNDKNISSYILPFHWGNEGTFDHRKIMKNLLL